MKKFCQDSGYSGRDLNQGPPEDEAGELTTLPRRYVLTRCHGQFVKFSFRLLRSILWTLSIVSVFCNHNVSREEQSVIQHHRQKHVEMNFVFVVLQALHKGFYLFIIHLTTLSAQVASNDRMIDKYQIGKNIEGRGCDLIA
jgi:hypothetical protein